MRVIGRQNIAKESSFIPDMCRFSCERASDGFSHNGSTPFAGSLRSKFRPVFVTACFPRRKSATPEAHVTRSVSRLSRRGSRGTSYRQTQMSRRRKSARARAIFAFLFFSFLFLRVAEFLHRDSLASYRLRSHNTSFNQHNNNLFAVLFSSFFV